MFLLPLYVLFLFWTIINSNWANEANLDEDPYSEYFENYYNEIEANDDNPEQRNAIRWDFEKWPEKTVPYKISSNYTITEARTVREALSVFDDKTCVKFVECGEKCDSGKRFLFFDKHDTFCGTRVGYQMIPSEQHSISLSSTCLRLPGAVQHESLHALGLYHEQSRSDRDNFLTIDWQNIPKRSWHNFIKVPDMYAHAYNSPYDFGSIMHYSDYAFAKDRNRPSMRVRKGTINPFPRMGQLDAPSQGDYDKVNRMYSCGDIFERN